MRAPVKQEPLSEAKSSTDDRRSSSEGSSDSSSSDGSGSDSDSDSDNESSVSGGVSVNRMYGSEFRLNQAHLPVRH